MERIRTIFVGAGPEGVSTLEYLLKDPEVEIVAVVTQIDKPQGRKQIMTPTPIKKIASAREIPVYEPQGKDREYKRILDESKPELIIVISFGEILPSFLVEHPKYKCLNIHYSLLPLLRGAVPVPMAILQGFKKTGITIQVMVSQLDEGPIVTQKEIDISPEDTTETLKEKLIFLGVDQLQKTLHPWIAGMISPKPQDNSKATYCYRKDISKENAEIDWKTMKPHYIERMVRAFVPWPIAWATLPNGKKLKIFSAALKKTQTSKVLPGQIIPDKEQLFFQTSDPQILLNAIEVQQEGKNRTTGKEFLKGYRQ